MLGQIPPVFRFLLGCLILFALLVFALAYNIGGISYESKAMVKLDKASGRVASLQAGLDSCHELLEKFDMKQDVSDSDILEQLRGQYESLNSQVKSLNEELDIEKKSLDECMHDKSSDRVAHLGTSEANASQVILRLQYERQALLQALEDVNETKWNARITLARIAQAYRIDNERLAADVAARGKKDEVESAIISGKLWPSSNAPSVVPPSTTTSAAPVASPAVQATGWNASPVPAPVFITVIVSKPPPAPTPTITGTVQA